MRNMWVKRLFRGALILILALVSVNLLDKSAQASTYQDGTYSIPVNVYKTGTTAPSLSAKFFGPNADVVVHNDNADVTMHLQGYGPRFLTSTIVNGQSALSSDKNSLNFTIPAGTKTVQAAFDIKVGAGMHEVGDFSYDWSGVPKDTDQSGSPAANNLQDSQNLKTDSSSPEKLPIVATETKKDSSGKTIGTTVVITNAGQTPVSFDVSNSDSLSFKPLESGDGYKVYVNNAEVATVPSGKAPVVTETKGPNGQVIDRKIVIDNKVVAQLPPVAVAPETTNG